MIIYKIENLLNGKVYIGQTVRSLNERISEHKRKGNILHLAINKYGWENFKAQIVFETECFEELQEEEIRWINVENSLVPNGYNIVEGGKGTKGYKHASDTKDIMRNKKQGKYLGENNPFYGKKHSQETLEKMRGRIMSEENKSKLKASHSTVRVINNTTGETFNSIKEASEKYGILATHITRVCRGKRKNTGGYSFSYI